MSRPLFIKQILFDSTYMRYLNASLVAQSIKNLPAMQESWVQFLGQEDPLEREMATHFSVLAWRIPGMGLHRVGHD